MRSLKDLGLVSVWVNPGHRLDSVRLLLQGHHLRAIAVVDGGKLVGVITAERAEMASDHATAGEVMRPVGVVLQSSLMVPKAAQMFIEENLDYAPVVQDEHLVGVLTAQNLLRELRRSWDPLTSLGWSDSLREWGTERLKAGGEISILFIDLDNFGLYNKAYGHVVGDRVLRRVAAVLRSVIDPARDILVRYAGDEFVIGTQRNHGEAKVMAEQLRVFAAEQLSDDLQRPISFTIGISGGRRQSERENVHYAATFDELINAASKACIAAKEQAARRTAAALASMDESTVTPAASVPSAAGAPDRDPLS